MDEKPVNNPLIRSVVLTTRIIIVSLVVGLLGFAAFVVLNPNSPREDIVDSFPPHTSTGLALFGILFGFFLPPMIIRNQWKAIAERRPLALQTRRRARYLDAVDLSSDESRLTLAYQSKTILGAAFLEGTAFFALFSYWQGRRPVDLLIAGTLVLLLLFKFPLRRNVERWVNAGLREIQDWREAHELS